MSKVQRVRPKEEVIIELVRVSEISENELLKLAVCGLIVEIQDKQTKLKNSQVEEIKDSLRQEIVMAQLKLKDLNRAMVKMAC